MIFCHFCRQVTLYEELLLLKDFEKSENQIAAKVEAKQQERLDMQAKVRHYHNMGTHLFFFIFG